MIRVKKGLHKDGDKYVFFCLLDFLFELQVILVLNDLSIF